MPPRSFPSWQRFWVSARWCSSTPHSSSSLPFSLFLSSGSSFCSSFSSAEAVFPLVVSRSAAVCNTSLWIFFLLIFVTHSCEMILSATQELMYASREEGFVVMCIPHILFHLKPSSYYVIQVLDSRGTNKSKDMYYTGRECFSFLLHVSGLLTAEEGRTIYLHSRNEEPTETVFDCRSRRTIASLKCTWIWRHTHFCNKALGSLDERGLVHCGFLVPSSEYPYLNIQNFCRASKESSNNSLLPKQS